MRLSCVWACLGAGLWGQGYSNFRRRCVCGVSGWVLLWAGRAGGGVSGALSFLGALRVSSLPGPVPSTCLIPLPTWRPEASLKTTLHTRSESPGSSNIHILYEGTWEEHISVPGTSPKTFHSSDSITILLSCGVLKYRSMQGTLHWIQDNLHNLATCPTQFYNPFCNTDHRLPSSIWCKPASFKYGGDLYVLWGGWGGGGAAAGVLVPWCGWLDAFAPSLLCSYSYGYFHDNGPTALAPWLAWGARCPVLGVDDAGHFLHYIGQHVAARVDLQNKVFPLNSLAWEPIGRSTPHTQHCSSRTHMHMQHTFHKSHKLLLAH